MAQREKLYEGMMLGEFKLVSELSDRKVGTRNRRFALAVCPVCEYTKEVRVDQAVGGLIKSCGCEFIRKRKEGNTKRWFTKEAKELSLRHNYMMQRCYNAKHKAYHNYGGRGVVVCKEWHDKAVFVNWGLLNGYSSELDLDKDKIGDGMMYSPDTCCFLTRKENLSYRRSI